MVWRAAPRSCVAPLLVTGIVFTATASANAPSTAMPPVARPDASAIATTLAREIVAASPRLQRPDGSFRDYVLDREHRRQLRYGYGSAILGYALLRSGVRDGDARAVASALRALRFSVTTPTPARAPPIVFKTFALASAYNFGTTALGSDPRFIALQPLLASWLRRARFVRLGHGARYGNQMLVEAVAALELLRSGLRSTVPGSILAKPAASTALVEQLINRRVPAIARRYEGALHRTVVSDPPTNPLAYHALSECMLARALELLGTRASPAAWNALEEAARASAALMAPDGDLAYFGRSQEAAWAAPMTAYAAAVAAQYVNGSPPPNTARLHALAGQALAGLRERYWDARFGVVITPALRDDLTSGVRALDGYAVAVPYTGLTLTALNWLIDEPRMTDPVAAVGVGDSRIGQGRGTIAIVRTRSLWFAVRQGFPNPRSRDLRSDWGLIALKARAAGKWRNVVPLRPRISRSGDSFGPSLIVGGHARRLNGSSMQVRRGGAVDVRGRFAGTSRAATVRFRPLPCGVRLSLPTRSGDVYEFSAAMRERSLALHGPRRLLTDARQEIEFGWPARMRLERGLASGAEARLVRVRLRFAPSTGRTLRIDLCARGFAPA